MVSRDDEHAERILSLIPINSLDPCLQDEALAQGELVRCKRRQVIFEEGERDPHAYYLLDGELELASSEVSPQTVVGGSDAALRAVAQLQPRRYTARALGPLTLFRIERAVLDHILADEQVSGDAGVVEVAELEEDGEDTDWMSRLLASELFTRLPSDNIQRFFAALEPFPAAKGQVVVEQGAAGDYFYIVAEGRCAVTRRANGSGRELELAVLREGESFGEESLISHGPRNASVRMLEAGFLMRLDSRSFEELVRKPTLKAVAFAEARRIVDAGGAWIDVRFEDEHQGGALPGSLNIPLNTLRLAAAKLDRGRRYVTYCDTGSRGSTGAFLLAKLGIDACYLASGLDRVPDGSTGADPGGAVPPDQPPPDGVSARDREAAADAGPVAPAPPEPAPAPAAELAALQAEMAKLRTAVATAQGERDRVAARGKQAMEAVGELKRRYGELRQAAQAERARREALEGELAAAQADARRFADMERARLEAELKKAADRAEAAESEQALLRARLAEESERLARQVEAAEARAAEAGARVDAAEGEREAAREAAEDRLAETSESLARERARAEQAEAALAEARESLDSVRADSDEAARDRSSRESELAHSLHAAEAALAEERTRSESETGRLRTQAEQSDAARRETEERLRSEVAAVQASLAEERERASALEQRVAELDDRRRQAEQALAEREVALSEEKSGWERQVEEAIAAERARLDETRARVEREAAEMIEAAAAELSAGREAEITAEHEARLAEAAANHEESVARLNAEHEHALASARSEAQNRLGEQEALLDDQRRRLELETVRLREALDEARQTIDRLQANRQPAATARAPVSGPETFVESEDPSDWLVVPGHEDARDMRPGAAPATPTAVESPDAPPEAQRVLDPAQIAEIRRKMREKLEAHRK